MKKYLLVEGITDIAFVKYVCFQKGITTKFDDFKKSKNQYIFDDLVLINLDGQSNLEKELVYLKDEEIEISQIGIIQDADDDFEKSIKSIKDAIIKSKIDKNKIEYFLTPNDKDLGDLETMLLSTIQDNNTVQCFEPYRKCLQSNNEIYEKALNKGQVHAYTMYSQSGKDLHKPHNSFMYKFEGKYIDTELWDLNKKEFQPIISFIEDIFKD